MNRPPYASKAVFLCPNGRRRNGTKYPLAGKKRAFAEDDVKY